MNNLRLLVWRGTIVIGSSALGMALLWRDRVYLNQLTFTGVIALVLLSITAVHIETKRISLGPAGSFSPAPMLLYVTTLQFGSWALLPVIFWTIPRWKGASGKLFNTAQRIVYASSANLVFTSVNAWGGGRLPYTVLAHVLAICVFIVVNLILVSAMKVANGEGTWPVFWNTYYAPIIPTYMDNLAQGAICVLIGNYIGLGGTAIAIYLAYSKLMVQANVVGGAIGKALSAESLIAAIDAKDAYTRNHSARVARHAQAIAEQLHLPSGVISDIAVASKLHDIGKIAVPDSVLQKAGSLTDDEFRLVQEHPKKSQQILSANPQLARIAEIVGQHHERYDGRGYPQGLKRDAISLEARIIACADAFDAMTTDRPYRRALTEAAAVAELRAHSGTQFDPEVVQAMLRHFGAHFLDRVPELHLPQAIPAGASVARLSISQDNGGQDN